jgi:hypothetical protein
MKNPVRIILALLPSLLLCSCLDAAASPEAAVNMLTLKDTSPPVLLSAQAKDEKTACLIFDEDVFALETSFEGMAVYSQGNTLYVDSGQPLDAGSSAEICGSVRDIYGNTTTFKVLVWGINPDPAQLRINEFTTKGSRTQPDRTELKVLRAGNIAGLVLYDGIPGDFRSRFIFPSEEVSAGSFVTVWWCDELPSGVKAKEGKKLNYASGGGLSENNGVLCLGLSPAQGAAVMDCVIWSSGESSQYEGYGTKEVLDRVNVALENLWWEGPPVYSGWSTSTRSMALDSSGVWYTTVQGGLSFGEENLSEAYSR